MSLKASDLHESLSACKQTQTQPELYRVEYAERKGRIIEQRALVLCDRPATRKGDQDATLRMPHGFFDAEGMFLVFRKFFWSSGSVSFFCENGLEDWFVIKMAELLLRMPGVEVAS